MAESVVIEELGRNVNEWMNEKTAQEILKTLNLGNAMSKKQAALMAKMAKNAGTGNGDAKSFKELQDAIKDTEKYIDDLGDETEETTENIRDLGKASKKSSSFFDTLSSTSSILGTAFGFLAGAITKQYKTAMELNEAGVMLESMDGIAAGMGAFGHAATQLNLSFSDLVNITKEYSQVINQVGIVQFSKTMKNIRGDLEKFGITNREGAELAAEYIESQRQLGIMQDFTTAKAQRNLKENIEETALFGRVLGISRKEIEKRTANALKDANTAFSLSNATEEVRRSFKTLSKLMPDSAQSVLDASQMFNMAGSEVYTQLAIVGNDARQAFVNLADDINSGADTGTLIDSTIAFGKSLEDVNVDLIKAHMQAGSLDKSTGQMMIDMKKRNAQLSKLYGKEREEFIAKMKSEAETAKAGKKVQDAMTELSSIVDRSINAFFQSSGLLDVLNTSVEGTASVFEKAFSIITSEIGGFVKSFIEPFGKETDGVNDGLSKLKKWFANLKENLIVLKEGLSLFFAGIKKVTEWIGALSDTIKIAVNSISDFAGIKIDDITVSIVSGFAAIFGSVFLITGITKALTAGIGTAFGSAMGGLGKVFSKDRDTPDNRRSSRQRTSRSNRPAKSMGVVGNLLRDIVGGLTSGAIGGILSGLALGLEAFGKAGAMAVKGAGILATAITVIGAGIAGASWILGKALPTFAEGMKSFETLDGDQLRSVGAGIRDIGVGIAAFGAGGVANILSSMGEAFMDFIGLGDKSPIAKMKEFADLGYEISGPLKALGESLAIFAPNFDKFVDAISKDASDGFDFENFTLGNLSNIKDINTLGESLALFVPNFDKFTDAISKDIGDGFDFDNFTSSTFSEFKETINDFNADTYVDNITKMINVNDKLGKSLVILPETKTTLESATDLNNINKTFGINTSKPDAKIKQDYVSQIQTADKGKGTQYDEDVETAIVKAESQDAQSHININTFMETQITILKEISAELNTLNRHTRKTNSAIQEQTENT